MSNIKKVSLISTVAIVILSTATSFSSPLGSKFKTQGWHVQQPSAGCKQTQVKGDYWWHNKSGAQSRARADWSKKAKTLHGGNYSNYRSATRKSERCVYDQIDSGYLCYVSATPCSYSLSTAK